MIVDDEEDVVEDVELLLPDMLEEDPQRCGLGVQVPEGFPPKPPSAPSEEDEEGFGVKMQAPNGGAPPPSE